MNIFDEMNRSRNAALWQMLRRGVGFSSSTPVVPTKPDQPAAEAFNDALAKAKPDSKGVKHVTLGKEIADQIEGQKDGNVAFVIESDTNVEVTIPEGVTIYAPAEDSTAPTARAARDLDCLFLVKNGATLTLKGKGVIDATQRGAELYCAIKLTNKGDTNTDKFATVIIDGVTVKGHYAAIAGNGLRSDTKIVVKSGKLEAVAAKEDGTPNNTTIFNPQAKSSVIITGGKLIGASNVVIKAGSLDITGGTFEANGEVAKYSQSNNGFNVTGHCVLVDNCGYPGGTPAVAISGGTFTAKTDKPVMIVNTETTTADVDLTNIKGVEFDVIDRNTVNNTESTDNSDEVSEEPQQEPPVEEPAPETGTSETEQA